MATQYRDGGEYYDIRVLVPDAQLRSRTDLENLIVKNNGGAPVYLRDIAEVRRAVGPVEIVRENQAKQVIVRADSVGIRVGEGGDMLMPMAVAVIGGLVYSLGLTLFFLPAAYGLVFGGREPAVDLENTATCGNVPVKTTP